MRRTFVITAEEKEQIEAARKANKDKRIERRLRVLSLRGEGKNVSEISVLTGYHKITISKITAQYFERGLEFMCQCHYLGNRRNMSVEQEAEFLKTYQEQAQQGQIVCVREISQAYQKAVGHRIGTSQIYCVLKRHGWRKLMPRSRHPKKATDEAIDASKKLTASIMS